MYRAGRDNSETVNQQTKIVTQTPGLVKKKSGITGEWRTGKDVQNAGEA
jgi:hypothetical protein